MGLTGYISCCGPWPIGGTGEGRGRWGLATTGWRCTQWRASTRRHWMTSDDRRGRHGRPRGCQDALRHHVVHAQHLHKHTTIQKRGHVFTQAHHPWHTSWDRCWLAHSACALLRLDRAERAWQRAHTRVCVCVTITHRSEWGASGWRRHGGPVRHRVGRVDARLVEAIPSRCTTQNVNPTTQAAKQVGYVRAHTRGTHARRRAGRKAWAQHRGAPHTLTVVRVARWGRGRPGAVAVAVASNGVPGGEAARAAARRIHARQLHHHPLRHDVIGVGAALAARRGVHSHRDGGRKRPTCARGVRHKSGGLAQHVAGAAGGAGAAVDGQVAGGGPQLRGVRAEHAQVAGAVLGQPCLHSGHAGAWHGVDGAGCRGSRAGKKRGRA
jgi:hypothetical protein